MEVIHFCCDFIILYKTLWDFDFYKANEGNCDEITKLKRFFYIQNLVHQLYLFSVLKKTAINGTHFSFKSYYVIQIILCDTSSNYIYTRITWHKSNEKYTIHWMLWSYSHAMDCFKHVAWYAAFRIQAVAPIINVPSHTINQTSTRRFKYENGSIFLHDNQ